MTPTGSPCRDKASVLRPGNATAEMDENQARSTARNGRLQSCAEASVAGVLSFALSLRRVLLDRASLGARELKRADPMLAVPTPRRR